MFGCTQIFTEITGTLCEGWEKEERKLRGIFRERVIHEEDGVWYRSHHGETGVFHMHPNILWSIHARHTRQAKQPGPKDGHGGKG